MSELVDKKADAGPAVLSTADMDKVLAALDASATADSNSSEAAAAGPEKVAPADAAAVADVAPAAAADAAAPAATTSTPPPAAAAAAAAQPQQEEQAAEEEEQPTVQTVEKADESVSAVADEFESMTVFGGKNLKELEQIQSKTSHLNAGIGFDDPSLGIPAPIVASLIQEMRFKKPSLIQAMTLPIIFSGRNLIAQAQSG
jgi:hypothetical protein